MKRMKNYIKGMGIFATLSMMSFSSFAATTDSNQAGGLSNETIFYVLAILAVLLLVGIFFLTSSVKDLMKSEFYKTKVYEQEEKKRAKNNSNTALAILAILGMPFASFSQGTVAATENADFPLSWVWMMVVVNIILLGVVFYVRTLFFQILRSVKPRKVIVKEGVEITEPSKITQILTDAVPLDKEHEILMDHEYDGIMELDNNLPPWWLYSFYVSIVFAFVYIINYHVIEAAPLQQEEYELAMAEGEKEVAEYLASQKLNVDESNVVLLTEASDLSKGKGIFEKKCVACHGKQAEGVIGPNLTDNYWIHGGDIVSVFKIVKYGKAEKGMQAWKDELNPIEMQQVSSYIKSLAGTAVGIGKAPQGELYKESTAAPEASDSTNNSQEISVEVAQN